MATDAKRLEQMAGPAPARVDEVGVAAVRLAVMVPRGGASGSLKRLDCLQFLDRGSNCTSADTNKFRIVFTAADALLRSAMFSHAHIRKDESCGPLVMTARSARWRGISRRRGGRPWIASELRDLIRRMSLENPLWGAPRIHGELLKLGFQVSQSSVSRYMVPRRGRPTQSWATFLRNHVDGIAAIDMLAVPTVMFEWLYAFVVLGHGKRKILHTEVTAEPTAEWLAQQLTEAFPWNAAPHFLVRDNDGAYGTIFRRRLWAMGIRDRPTQIHSPWQNGHVERLIGSIRRECLDHVIVFNAAHLRRVLRSYADYYNNDRTHLALNKDSPNSRTVEHDGTISARPVLGGLHHRYVRKVQN